MNTTAPVRIDIWSDYVCPFCYLELPPIQRLQQEHAGQVEVVWRAFELRPDPKPTLDPDGEYLHTTWNRSVYPMAAERGMTLKLPPVQPRSRLAFEAVAHARELGRFDAMHAALFRAFFVDGRDIGNPDVLAEIGVEIGLERQGLVEALASGRHTAAVHEDQQLAYSLGVAGVPIMVFRPAGAGWERAFGVRGAVPYETMASALRQALDEAARQAT
ncbi:DsbA family oxidoreductase [Massilia sp. IC2-477]|uniref:DsbA family oxidoreductase n=1 Tax=Massilia sp. IC2-477 TaxID=2887198 RepID=UPI001D12B685|nr:DsbA family oxidoreductase [Massilia sp. IC2-477]MCC2957290.1 DsbA family oxidoreductase [Massilia sp. IC2-477]